nr:MAG TPA: KilAC domain protein [Caudoviricetes sp.]
MQLTRQETMTSLQIAEVTGKPHNDVLKAIRAMEPAWVKITQGKFSLSTYTDKSGKSNPCYQLTKTECLYIATKFNDEARAKLVIRWEELERQNAQPSIPQNFAEALRLAATQQEQLEAQRAELEAAAPKVAFANAMLASKNSCLVGELAKIISQNGYTIGQNRLFQWLRENGYLGKCGEYYNIPNQRHIEQGLFEVKRSTRSGSSGELYNITTTKVTPKGQEYFLQKFMKQ